MHIKIAVLLYVKPIQGLGLGSDKQALSHVNVWQDIQKSCKMRDKCSLHDTLIRCRIVNISGPFLL